MQDKMNSESIDALKNQIALSQKLCERLSKQLSQQTSGSMLLGSGDCQAEYEAWQGAVLAANVQAQIVQQQKNILAALEQIVQQRWLIYVQCEEGHG